MRSAALTLLVAALASVSSAAPAATGVCPPAGPAASALPAKFTLSYVPLQSGPLPAAGGNIVAEVNYDLFLWANTASKKSDPLVTFNSNSTSNFSAAAVDHSHLGWVPGSEWRANWFVSLGKEGRSVKLALPQEIGFPLLTDGLGVVNGGLTWRFDGWSQSQWTMCLSGDAYSLSWGQTGSGCVPVQLKVNAL